MINFIRMTPKLRTFFGAFALLLPSDWASKLWIDQNLSYAERVPIIDGVFYISHVRNPGAAFGILADSPEPFRKYFFIFVTLIAGVFVFSFLRNLPADNRRSALALSLVFSGALGNFLDRLFRGEVVDFLLVILPGGYSWPDFNFADTFIVIGTGVLLFELVVTEGKNEGVGS